ncbi:MAG: hypothetical protein HYX32_14000 [Actinobacteria bacterium]|nr:hypothetical protein [Actinomycetota bacterium]
MAVIGTLVVVLLFVAAVVGLSRMSDRRRRSRAAPPVPRPAPQGHLAAAARFDG